MPGTYTNYQLTDFLTDQNFKNWIKNGKPKSEHWHVLLLENGDKRAMMVQAEAIILKLSGTDESHSKVQQLRTWQTIAERILKEDQNKSWTATKRFYAGMTRYAAVIAMVAVSIGVCAWLYFNDRTVQHQTGNGEQLSVTLPDASTVVLAANSSLRYDAIWDEDKVREVWVDGEAHFNVRHINRDQGKITGNHRFVAHMSNNLNVEVLGTVFNVYSRRKKTSVALVSGSVAVSDAAMKMILKPGEMATRTPKDALLKTTTNGALAYDWNERELVMNQVDVGAVMVMLEDHFGKQISLNSKTLSSKKLDGAIPLVNEKETLAVLAAILNASVEQVGNKIIIKESNILAE